MFVLCARVVYVCFCVCASVYERLCVQIMLFYKHNCERNTSVDVGEPPLKLTRLHGLMHRRGTARRHFTVGQTNR
jgi:hypothetical protein